MLKGGRLRRAALLLIGHRTDFAADGGELTVVRCRAAIQLKGEMEQAFAGIHIPSTVAFDHPNLRQEQYLRK